jgi:hypothetical protein
MLDADKTDEGERQTVDHFAFTSYSTHVRKMKTDLTPTLPSPVRETGRPFRLLSAGTDHELTKKSACLLFCLAMIKYSQVFINSWYLGNLRVVILS